MRDNCHIPRNPLIAALTIALLFLGACAQKMETPATDSNAARGADPEGYRAEFVRLVKMAETLDVVARR
jgi:outer membrane lipoprotein-sorting protein